MEELAKQARAAVEQLGTRGRTTRIPDEVRQAVMAYVTEARAHEAAGAPGGVIVVTTPSGYRIEGLRVDEAAALLRTLS